MSSTSTYPERNLISSEDVEGSAVFSRRGEQIGSIDHLMIDKLSGQVRYAVISFGGILGLGHSHYPLPWGALEYEPTRAGYLTDISASQLVDAPEFSDDSWSDRTWEQRVHMHYGVPPYWS